MADTFIDRQKQSLRDKYKKIRDLLSDKDERSDRIINNVLKLPKYHRANRVFGYISLPEEVQTTRLFQESWDMKKQVFVPVVRSGIIMVAKYTGKERLIKGELDILEPEVKDRDIIGPGHIDLDIIFVPGIVFNFRGVRIGYGGGYFDRFFKAYPETFKVGLAFLEQLVDDDLPLESHDRLVDMVIVDK